MTKLNLGCGADYRPGYVNVDTNRHHKVDLLEDITWLKSISSASCTEAVAQDVLEHLPRAKADTALKEWNRVLKVGGTLGLRVPSLVHLLAKLQKATLTEQRELVKCLYGTQGYQGDFHLNGYTEQILRADLEFAGFVVTEVSLRDEWLFDVRATKVKDRFPAPMLRVESDQQFVDLAFKSLLGREPDAGGKAYFLEMLKSGIARESIVEVLQDSDEHRRLKKA